MGMIAVRLLGLHLVISIDWLKIDSGAGYQGQHGVRRGERGVGTMNERSKACTNSAQARHILPLRARW